MVGWSGVECERRGWIRWKRLRRGSGGKLAEKFLGQQRCCGHAVGLGVWVCGCGWLDGWLVGQMGMVGWWDGWMDVWMGSGGSEWIVWLWMGWNVDHFEFSCS